MDRLSRHPDILFAVAIMTASIFYDFTAANRLQAAIAVSNTSVFGCQLHNTAIPFTTK
jgi:hypothetical protein